MIAKESLLMLHERLFSACTLAGVDARDAKLIKLGAFATFRLRNRLVARVSRFPEQKEVSYKEVLVARWLDASGVSATRVAIPPVQIDECVVTFWRELIDIRPATPSEIGSFLKQLHAVNLPKTFTLPDADPFYRVAENISSSSLSEPDKDFLSERLARLRLRWGRSNTFDLPTSPVHGDPHDDNIVTVGGVVTVLDLESFSIGPPEWDLALIAAEYDSFRWMSEEKYKGFSDAYGFDVLATSDYSLLRDIRELRMVSWLTNKVGLDHRAVDERGYWLSCIRDEEGPRPWRWTCWRDL